MKGPCVKTIAALYASHWNRHYTASKLRTDPLYQALHATLDGSSLPLLDLGCGLGISAFYLRGMGVDVPIHGLDYDDRKIEAARRAAERSGFTGLTFSQHDARNGLPEHRGNVSILDILQFFTPAEQETLLREAAERVSPGGRLVVRSGLRDASSRFRITVVGDLLARATCWMKAAPTHYPTAGDFRRMLSPFGDVRITPLWGKTPFNNHLIVLSRPGFK
jgi:2-polyprenyl-3-methyl-5-hydroxy-6-metoxy-1,4-benzoquinol methylase